MGFSRESSYKLIKRVSPSLSMKKNSTISGRNDQFCRLSSTGNTEDDARGAVHKHAKKAAAVFPEPEVVVGADDQLENARLADESDCLWLSSYCKSPSFSFDDPISWDVCKLESNSLSLNKLCSSLPSKSSDISFNKRSRFFDGSIVNPIEEASLVLERTSDSVVSFSWSVDSHYESSLFEESAVSGSAWTSPGTHDHASFLIRNEAGVQVSLLDLDREDSEWISDTNPGLDVLQSDFPSPSYKINWNSEVRFSHCDSFPSVERKHKELIHALPSKGEAEATHQGDVDTDEPLFWPLQRKLEWNAEIAWEFCISPRKSVRKIGNCERSLIRRSKGLGLNERKLNLEEGCNRNLMSNPVSKMQTSMECKVTDVEKGIRRSSTMPARLSRSFKDPIRKIYPSTKDKKEEPTSYKTQTKTLMEDFQFLDEFFMPTDDLSIETLIGLNEFDGREGVDPEFDKDQFLLDD